MKNADGALYHRHFSFEAHQKYKSTPTTARPPKRPPAKKWQRSEAGFESLKNRGRGGGSAEFGGGVKFCYECQNTKQNVFKFLKFCS